MINKNAHVVVVYIQKLYTLIGVSYCLLQHLGKSRSLYIVTFNWLALFVYCITRIYKNDEKTYLCHVDGFCDYIGWMQ